ncbi:MAG TPA: site-specific integrase [Thermoplasmatales archaeon]|nr:site-specific integrase [Thermoplasmatales archaeon]
MFVSEIIYLQPDEVKKLINTIDNLEDKALIVTGLETGMRVSEITKGFFIEMINWDSGTAKIFDEKKDLWREIAIPRNALNLLKMYLNAEKRKKGPVFPFTYKTANRKLMKWIKKAGIQKYKNGRPVNFTWHKLRHTFVRLSAQAHRDPMAVAQQTGDRLTTVLKIYGTWLPSAMAKHFDEKPLVKGE